MTNFNSKRIAESHVGRSLSPTIIDHRNKKYVTTDYGCGYAGRASEPDHLVRDALSWCDKLKKGGRIPEILEVGCGDGSTALAFAQQGALVTAIDRENNLRDNAKAIAEAASDKITFLFKPAQHLKSSDMPDDIHIFFSNRTLHWMPYNQTKALLEQASRKMRPASKLFISVMNFKAHVAEGYPYTAHTPIARRFAPSSSDSRFKHPLTLYTASEITGLLETTGFDIDKLEKTDWGLYRVRATRNHQSIIHAVDRLQKYAR